MNLHESTQEDIAHYNYKGSCGLSEGCKCLHKKCSFPIAESCAGGMEKVRIRLRPSTQNNVDCTPTNVGK